jgi:FkbM family methyltransferase
MNLKLKHKLWDFIRPFHSPLTRALRRRLGRNYHDYPEMELPPPYDAIQLDVERHLHDYLHLSPDKISQIIIVGANRAEEIGRFRRLYSRALFLCFEPNPNDFEFLREKFGRDAQVSVSNLALSDSPGNARFYELAMAGNGSLLEPDVESWATTNKWNDKSMASFEVEMSTLDHEAAKLPAIDLLWMDVQGAEGKVLSGATETLKRTKAVFIEIALFHSPYKGAELFPAIKMRLEAADFTCIGLGVDARTGTGNAFFVKHFDRLICK